MFETEEQLNRARFELNAAKKADQDLSGFEWLTAHQVFEVGSVLDLPLTLLWLRLERGCLPVD